MRVRQFLSFRSIWLDEASFAHGILDNGLFDLLTTKQRFVDPIGFVVSTKLGTQVFGQTEFAFRWIALLAGVASVGIAALLALRVFRSGLGRVVFTALVAISPVLVYYSDEAQQYSLDVLSVLLILWVFASYRSWDRGFLYLVLVGAILPWFSYSAVIVMFGVGVVLAIRWLREKEYAKLLGLGSVWGITAFVSLFHARLITRTDFLEDYWLTGFAPFPPLSSGDVRWYADAPAGIVEIGWFIEGFVQRVVTPSLASYFILALIAVGLYLLARRLRGLALAIGVIGVAALIVSILELYPFGSRPGIYMVPIAFLLAVEPIDNAASRRSLLWRLPAVLVSLALLAAPAISSAQTLVTPHNSSDMKSALAYVEAHQQPGDWLVVHGWSSRAFEFYAPRYDLRPAVTLEVSNEFDVDLFLSEIGIVPGRERTWVIFSHRIRESREFVDELAERATLLDRSDGEYVVALFDFSALD